MSLFSWAEEKEYSLLPVEVSLTEPEWAPVEWDISIPKQVKSMDFPISSVFCHCFQQELDQLYLEWLDENGNLVEKQNAFELEKILQKMNLLNVSIQYLNGVVPCGR
jgi:hypothetical protein